MLRTIERTNNYVFLDQLRYLKFICDNKEYLLEKLGNVSLDYSLSDADEEDSIVSTEKDNLNKYEVIRLKDFMFLNYSVDFCNCNFYDSNINMKYLKYLGNKFGGYLDPYYCLEEFYDEEENVYYEGENRNETSYIPSEIIISSKKLDLFIEKYKCNKDKMKELNQYLKYTADFVTSYKSLMIDIRTDTNMYYHTDVYNENKYQICFIYMQDNWGSNTKQYDTYDSLSNMLKLNKMLELEGSRNE